MDGKPKWTLDIELEKWTKRKTIAITCNAYISIQQLIAYCHMWFLLLFVINTHEYWIAVQVKTWNDYKWVIVRP